MKRVLLVEDTLMDQVRMKAMLTDCGFTHIDIAPSIQKARLLLQKTPPSLLIADVFLQDETILVLLSNIKEYAIPTIFITASQDSFVYNQITAEYKCGYLVKPFDTLTLRSTIELLSFRSVTTEPPGPALFIRQQRSQKKVLLSDILWLEATGNYVIMVTASERHAVKKSLRKFMQELDERFVRVHKNYCVNILNISHLRSNSVVINNQEIPVSYSCKKTLLEQLGKFK